MCIRDRHGADPIRQFAVSIKAGPKPKSFAYVLAPDPAINKITVKRKPSDSKNFFFILENLDRGILMYLNLNLIQYMNWGIRLQTPTRKNLYFDV